MSKIRIPLAANLESRDGALDQDVLMKNAIAEKRGNEFSFRKRPGVTTANTPTDKLALLYSKSRTYTTDDLMAVAMDADAFSTIYGMIVEDGDSTGGKPAVFYLTWSGSAWNAASALGVGTFNGTSAFGAAQLDGYFFMLSRQGRLHNSGLNNPSSWGTSDYVVINQDGSAGVAVTRYLNYIIGFTKSSMQAFYNAANPTGSVLSKVDGGYIEVGCASGRSMAVIDNRILFLGRGREKGLGVYMMSGLQAQRISTPAIDRLLALDSLAAVYGQGMTCGGHNLYILTFTNTAITLVYDIDIGVWCQWTTLTVAASKSVTSITRSGTTATVTTSSAHGFADGDPELIAGADQGEYNGHFQISYVSPTAFKIEVAGSPATPATGTITAAPYTESYFEYPRFIGTDAGGVILKTTGTTWYKFSDTTYQDNSVPINCFARTVQLDGGSAGRKTMPRMTVIGDKVSDTAMLRYSDNDSSTFSAHRRVTLSDERPMVRRCGSFRRRSIEYRHIGNVAQNIEALELEMEG